MNSDEKALNQKIIHSLDESLELDTTTQNRLAETRARALNKLHENSKSSSPVVWWGAATSAVAIMLAVTVYLVQPATPPLDNPEILAFEWLTSETEPELLLSDLEFYEWATEQNPG